MAHVAAPCVKSIDALASIALGWVGEPALATLAEPLLAAALPAAWAAAAVHPVAFAFALITFMRVVFVRLTRPFVALLNGTGNAILRRCGYAPAGAEANAHSVDEFDLLIEDTREAGVISDRQAEFARKVFRLSGRRVADCMVPRERMAALPLGTPPDRILERVRSGAHTRMPVYDGDPDNVVGVVNAKDLFHLFSIKGFVILEDAVYPPLFLKPDDAVADALELFRRERRPLAVIREDAGRVLGLITLEDVLEQIVGPLEDEHDRSRG